MMTRPMPGWSFKVPRSTEMNTSICPVRRSWALTLLPETRPAYGSYLSQSISLVASLSTPEKVSSVKLMKGPSASRTNLFVEMLWGGGDGMARSPPEVTDGEPHATAKGFERVTHRSEPG